MDVVSRAALIIKPKQPHIDWANQSDGPKLVSEDVTGSTVFLVPDVEAQQARSIVKKYYKTIFEQELLAIHSSGTPVLWMSGTPILSNRPENRSVSQSPMKPDRTTFNRTCTPLDL